MIIEVYEAIQASNPMQSPFDFAKEITVFMTGISSQAEERRQTAMQVLEKFIMEAAGGKMDFAAPVLVENLAGLLANNAAPVADISGNTVNTPLSAAVKNEQIDLVRRQLIDARERVIKTKIENMVPFLPRINYQAGVVSGKVFGDVSLVWTYSSEAKKDVQNVMTQFIHQLEHAISLENQYRLDYSNQYLRLLAHEAQIKWLQNRWREAEGVDRPSISAQIVKARQDLARERREMAQFSSIGSAVIGTGLMKSLALDAPMSDADIQAAMDSAVTRVSAWLVAESIVTQISLALQALKDVSSAEIGDDIRIELQKIATTSPDKLIKGEGVDAAISTALARHGLSLAPVQKEIGLAGFGIVPTTKSAPKAPGKVSGLIDKLVDRVTFAPGLRFDQSQPNKVGLFGVYVSGDLWNPAARAEKKLKAAEAEAHDLEDGRAREQLRRRYDLAGISVEEMTQALREGDHSGEVLARLLTARLSRGVLASVVGEKVHSADTQIKIKETTTATEETDSIARVLAAAKAKGTPAGQQMALLARMHALEKDKEGGKWKASYRVGFPGPKTATITRDRTKTKEKLAVLNSMGKLEDGLVALETEIETLQTLRAAKAAYLAFRQNETPETRAAWREARYNLQELLGDQALEVVFAVPAKIADIEKELAGIDLEIESRERQRPQTSLAAQQLEVDALNQIRKQVLEGKPDISVTLPISPEAMSVVYAGMNNVMTILGLFHHGNAKERAELVKELDHQIQVRDDLIKAMKANLAQSHQGAQIGPVGLDDVVLVWNQDVKKFFLIKEVTHEEKGQVQTYFIVQPIEQSTLTEPHSLVRDSRSALNLGKLASFGDPVIVTAVPKTVQSGGQEKHILDVVELNPIKQETYNRCEIQGDGLEALMAAQQSVQGTTASQRNVTADVLRQFVVGQYTGRFSGSFVSNTDPAAGQFNPAATPVHPFTMPNGQAQLEVVGKNFGVSGAGNYDGKSGDAVFKGFWQANKNVNFGIGAKPFDGGGNNEVYGEATITSKLINAALNIGKDTQTANIRQNLPNQNVAMVLTIQNAQAERIIAPSVLINLGRAQIDAGYRNVNIAGQVSNEYFYSAHINLVQQIALQIDQIVKAGGNQEAWLSLINRFKGSRGSMILRGGYTSDVGAQMSAGYSRTITRGMVVNALLNVPMTKLNELSWSLSAQRTLGTGAMKRVYGLSAGMDTTGAFRAGVSGDHALAARAIMRRYGVSDALYDRAMGPKIKPLASDTFIPDDGFSEALAMSISDGAAGYELLARSVPDVIKTGIQEVREGLGNVQAGLAGTGAADARLKIGAEAFNAAADKMTTQIDQITKDLQAGRIPADAAVKAVKAFEKAFQDELEQMSERMTALDQVEKGPRRGMTKANATKQAIHDALERIAALRERVDEEFARYLFAMTAIQEAGKTQDQLGRGIGGAVDLAAFMKGQKNRIEKAREVHGVVGQFVSFEGLQNSKDQKAKDIYDRMTIYKTSLHSEIASYLGPAASKEEVNRVTEYFANFAWSQSGWGTGSGIGSARKFLAIHQQMRLRLAQLTQRTMTPDLNKLDLKDPKVWNLLDELASTIYFGGLPAAQANAFLDSLVPMIPILEQKLGTQLDLYSRKDIHLLMDFANDNLKAVSDAIKLAQMQGKKPPEIKKDELNNAAATYAQMESFVRESLDHFMNKAAEKLQGDAKTQFLSQKEQKVKEFTNLIFNRFYNQAQVGAILSVQTEYLDLILNLLGKTELTSMDLKDSSYLEFSYWVFFVIVGSGDVRDTVKLRAHLENMKVIKKEVLRLGLFSAADFDPATGNREAYQVVNYLAGLKTFGDPKKIPNIPLLLEAASRLVGPGEKLNSQNMQAYLEEASVLLAAEDLLRQNRRPDQGQATAMLEEEIKGLEILSG